MHTLWTALRLLVAGFASLAVLVAGAHYLGHSSPDVVRQVTDLVNGR